MALLTIVGGVYREVVMWPPSDEVFGSAGRAACAIAQLGGEVRLCGFADELATDTMTAHAAAQGFIWEPCGIERGVSFHYQHGLATPTIIPARGVPGPLKVSGECVVRYGMIEGDAIIEAEYAVYDPQNTAAPQRFAANGSRAKHLAIVLNEHEAAMLLGGRFDAEVASRAIADLEQAEVVVLKRGPRGALVFSGGNFHTVPAFETRAVSKIGSGDYFVAHFAYCWLVKKMGPEEAALHASRSTALYCESGLFPTAADLEDYSPPPLSHGPKWLSGKRSKIYLAGPFFTLGQMWIIEQARQYLSEMGMDVFSPFHDVGRGEASYVVPLDLKAIRDCDLMFAVADGLDSGTIYEIGYARAHGCRVIVYAENETTEDLKMMEGSDCFICSDFVSAIYRAAWSAASL